MYFHDHQETDTVCTQPLSPDGDELCSHLPEELIVKILLRLPVRSLLQFKCICKSWKTLISDPQFVKRHLRISAAELSLTHHRLFFSHLSEPDKIVSYSLKPLFQNLLTPVGSGGRMKQQYGITGSCNGLLCLYNRYKHCVRLCNPSINFKSKKSPKAVSIDWINMQHGFGYDHVNDKYKVLLVVVNKNNIFQKLTKIYTFGEDSWKTIHNFPCFPFNPSVFVGKFVSGTLNWIVDKRGVSSNQYVILSFDLEKETYTEMPPPQNHGCRLLMLYVLNNCLGVSYETNNKTHWVAWLMKEYGVVDSWTKFMIIPLDKFIQKEPFIILRPLFISENGGVLLVNQYTSQFILYNLNSGRLDYSLINTNSRTLNLLNLHVCCESLVSF